MSNQGDIFNIFKNKYKLYIGIKDSKILTPALFKNKTIEIYKMIKYINKNTNNHQYSLYLKVNVLLNIS